MGIVGFLGQCQEQITDDYSPKPTQSMMNVIFDFLNSIQYEKIKDVHGDTYELNDVNVSSLLESMCDIIITYITSNEYDTNSESYKNLLKWFASDKHIAPEFIKKLQENSIDPDTIPELKGQLKL